jgi:hypothetical protein
MMSCFVLVDEFSNQLNIKDLNGVEKAGQWHLFWKWSCQM